MAERRRVLVDAPEAVELIGDDDRAVRVFADGARFLVQQGHLDESLARLVEREQAPARTDVEAALGIEERGIHRCGSNAALGSPSFPSLAREAVQP